MIKIKALHDDQKLAKRGFLPLSQGHIMCKINKSAKVDDRHWFAEAGYHAIVCDIFIIYAYSLVIHPFIK